MSKLTQFFLDWKVKLGIIAITFASLFAWHKIEVNKAVQEAVAEIHISQAKETFRLKEQSLNAQIALQESFDKIQKDKDEKLQVLNTRVASLTASLQSRPSRTESSGVSDNSSIAEVGQGSNGTGLYREDSEFLLGEATRAELIKEELFTCYRSYDEAKQALDRFKADNSRSK